MKQDIETTKQDIHAAKQDIETVKQDIELPDGVAKKTKQHICDLFNEFGYDNNVSF